MTMTEREIRRRFANASTAFIAANANAKEELHEPEPLNPKKPKEGDAPLPQKTSPKSTTRLNSPGSPNRSAPLNLPPNESGSNAANGSEPQSRPAFRLLVKLPIPPKSLSLNARCHWAKKAKDVKKYRLCAMLAARAALSGPAPMLASATVHVSWFHRTGHRIDGVENIHGWLKSAFDGFQDARIYANDRDLIALQPFQATDKLNPRVEILVTA